MELKPLFRDIADAIRQKDGTTEPITASSFPARIRGIPSGPVSTASPKDVNFFDYDGTLVYSYTLAEAQKLTALPDGPVHDGLVFQGWNWSLEKVKALTRPMNVGAMYITDDGKTRLKIRIWDLARSNVPLCISQTVANGVTIDWGDGSAPETLDGTGNVNTTHQYAAAGDYTIALTVADGCTMNFGDGTSRNCILGSTNNNTGNVYCSMLQEANIGNCAPQIASYSFTCCSSMKSITIPSDVTKIGFGALYICRSLKSVTIPNGVTSIMGSTFGLCSSCVSVAIPESLNSYENRVFNTCSSLTSSTIPDRLINVGDGLFRTCYSLTRITIPDGVTSIGSNAFSNCYGMAEYHLKPATPPTLVDVNAFEGIPADCIIYVPAGSLEAYKTAENWNAYADYMREEQE